MDNTNYATIPTFDPNAYLNSLLNDIGFENTEDEERGQMYTELEEQMSHLIFSAIADNITPEQMEETLINNGENENLNALVEAMVEISQEAQIAILDELDKFYSETIEAYERFKS